MAAEIFISYSTKDQKIADRICNALESTGFDCWISGRDVGPGENFQESIVRAIRVAKVMVLVFTENANNSAEIRKEVVLAGRHNLLIIPLRIEDVPPNDALAYEFATRQWIDFFDDWDQATRRLIAHVASIAQRKLGKEVAEPPRHNTHRSSGEPSCATPLPENDTGQKERLYATRERVIIPPPPVNPVPTSPSGAFRDHRSAQTRSSRDTLQPLESLTESTRRGPAAILVAGSVVALLGVSLLVLAGSSGRAIATESLIVWIMVGSIAGWLAGLLVRGFGFGLIGNIAVGMIGGVVAGSLLPRFGLGIGSGIIGAVLNGAIGAATLLVIVGLIRRPT